MVNFGKDFNLKFSQGRIEFLTYDSGELYQHILEKPRGKWRHFSKGLSEVRWFPEKIDDISLAIIDYLEN